MENPEHKIKEAFAAKDANTVFAGKNEMWSRLNNAMNKPKGVTAFWRVAAVFLGLLLTAGVFAGISFRAKMQQQKLELKAENEQLQLTIDSLLTLPVRVQTETRVVEKVVYRNRLVQAESSAQTYEWEKKYRQLQDSSEAILANKTEKYRNNILELQAELDSVKANFVAYKNGAEKQNEPSGNAPFQLKSERVELGVQKSKSLRTRDMELKVFPVNFQENKNNLNKSILKK